MRVFAATEAKTAGYGGIAAVSLATGLAGTTIGRGLRELAAADKLKEWHALDHQPGDEVNVA